MYTEFYNLQEKPFDLTHSSRYLYLGEAHKEALAMLTYGVMERKGFVLLTGEVGAGKTTILRALLNDLDKSVKYVHLAHPLLSPKEFMNYLTLSAFKNRIAFKSKAEFLLAFEAFLTRCSQHQRHFLLVVDEAHKLSYDLLEEIRLLSNMETADEKLISIFLVGQPELNQKLSDPRCRALLQRISIRYHIKPLNLNETEEYLTKRLAVAGARKADDVFPPAVRRAIHECSGGFPRMINILSDNLLLLGYARGQRKLTAAMVRECHQDLKLDDSIPTAIPEPLPKIAGTKPDATTPSPGHSGLLRWTLISLLVIFAAATALYFRHEIRSKVVNLMSRASELSSPRFVQKKGQVDGQVPGTTSLRTMEAGQLDADRLRTSAGGGGGEAQKKTEDAGLAGSRSSGIAPTGSSAEALGPHTDQNRTKSDHLILDKSAGPGPLGGEIEVERLVEAGSREDFGKTIIVQDGDTLDKLAKKIYGRSDERIWEMIQKSNPDIRDVDFIRPGQRLYFPAFVEQDSSE
jgi:type II secretory pathway predicted ATPase ExeA/phage tail protein X